MSTSRRRKTDPLTYADGLPIKAGDEVAIQRRFWIPLSGVVTYVYDPESPPEREFNDYGFCVRTGYMTTRWYGGSPDDRLVFLKRKARKHEDGSAGPRKAHDPDYVPSTWFVDRVPTEPAGPPHSQCLQGSVQIDKTQIFPTAGGGELHLRPGGVNAEFWISVAEPRQGWGEDELVIETCLADNDGGWWACRSYMDVKSLVRTEQDAPFIGWNAAPTRWHDALKDNCLLSGLHAMLDRRKFYDLRLRSGEPPTVETYLVNEKYQGPRVDLALISGMGTLLVRVSGLIHEVYHRDDIDAEAHIGMLPDYAYELPLSVLFPLVSFGHRAVRYGWVSEPVENPIKFERLGGGRPAQQTVVATTGR